MSYKMKGLGKKGNVGGVKAAGKKGNVGGVKAAGKTNKGTKIAKAKRSGDLMTKAGKAKSFSTGSKKILSRAAKASRTLRGAGAGLLVELGYRAYKSGQKKSGGKAVKGQKTNALKMRKSIFKK